MPAIGLAVVLVGVAGFLALAYAIDRETADPRITDRRTAEREAMARGGRRPDEDRPEDRDGADEVSSASRK